MRLRSASWDKHRAVQANLTSSDIQNSAPTDPDLVCPLCSRLLRDAVKTGCCSTSYCEECIHNYLSENDFVCPECESKIKSLKNLTKDEDRRERAKKYLEDTLKASKATGEAERTEKNGSDAGDSVSAGEGALSVMPNSSARDGKRKEGTPTGPPEEGELGRDGQVSAGITPASVVIATDACPRIAMVLSGRWQRSFPIASKRACWFRCSVRCRFSRQRHQGPEQ